MRTELQESTVKLRSRRGVHAAAGRRRLLEPLAVDAAMSDELPAGADEPAVDLLDSLSKQLDLLQQQEQQIRRLLARAGYVRIDGANA